ncbi:hypothetical protein BKA61DRAFT_617385 [Leptodontidium sp. MPI-SDFR-AT-0119]|nr:hypothetical protein BKA61DRAFT_617385 [Leptodontidium sp. MPI-SDFR-AT-0119]
MPSRVPFPETEALNLDQICLSNASFQVPGAATVKPSHAAVHQFLLDELNTPLLDELYPKLWLVGRRSGKSIDAIHAQIIKGRAIVPAEDPKLHLVWRSGRIYLKPIPVCILNHQFWEEFLVSESAPKPPKEDVNGDAASATAVTPIVMGFLRSYAFLIQHRLDFTLAAEHHLIPDGISWEGLAKFLANFRHISDDRISRRYHYGQLRISRLNWITRIYRPRLAATPWFYEIPHWAVLSYLESAISPLIFLFASLSVVLSSMQVILSVPNESLGILSSNSPKVQVVGKAFWGFSIATLIASCVVWVLLLVLPIAALGWQLTWGYTNRKNGSVLTTYQP